MNTRGLVCSGWEDLAAAMTEANALAALLTQPLDDDGVAVMEEFALHSVLKVNRLGASPRQLQHGTKGCSFLTNSQKKVHRKTQRRGLNY